MWWWVLTRPGMTTLPFISSTSSAVCGSSALVPTLTMRLSSMNIPPCRISRRWPSMVTSRSAFLIKSVLAIQGLLVGCAMRTGRRTGSFGAHGAPYAKAYVLLGILCAGGGQPPVMLMKRTICTCWSDSKWCRSGLSLSASISAARNLAPSPGWRRISALRSSAPS
ncbi:hypothetical protein D3C76_1356830 [compost metagenome]